MANRRRRPRRDDSWNGMLLAGTVGGALMLVRFVVQLVLEYPVRAALVLAGALMAACGIGWLRMQRSREMAEQERSVAVADVMSGVEFEHWVAQLLRASGCRHVQVSGGSGDMGADVTAYSPDGRWLVVQCKRYGTKVGSPDVQRFAGTARHIHGADGALLVTNNYLTAQATNVARQCRIDVVDRDVLKVWVASLVLPIAAAAAGTPSLPSALTARLAIMRRR